MSARFFWSAPALRAELPKEPGAAYDRVAALEPVDEHVEKQGRSTARCRLGSESLYLKKYPSLRWWERRLLPLSAFPGPRELANYRRTAALGIRVPEVLLAGACRRHPCASFFATRELAGYRPLHVFVPERRLPTPARHALALRLAEMVRRLHAARLYHRDLYFCHFFARETDGGPELVLIDLGRLMRSPRPRWRVKDLAQLLFSSFVPGVSRTDRMRFFHAYLGVKKLDPKARRLAAVVAAKAEGYRRHNERHPELGAGRTAA